MTAQPNDEELDFDEAEYALNNHIRITLQVESYTTEVYTNLGWMPVVDYVSALIKSERKAAEKAALERVQDEIVLHYYDTTVGRKLEEFILAELQPEEGVK